MTETAGGGTYNHVFQHTALGTTQVITNGNRNSYTRDPNGTLITQKAPDGQRYNLITDHQGSVLALLDTNGNLDATYTYHPYGLTAANGPEANTNHFRWLGQYELNLGIKLLGHRYYNPAWGRFTAPDPTKQETNPYNYATNNPINNSDPTGALSLSGGEIWNLSWGAVALAGTFVGLLAIGPATSLFFAVAGTISWSFGAGTWAGSPGMALASNE